MAYDEALAARIRGALAGREAITEKKMFGGIGFLHHGNMCVGAASQGGLIVRLGEAGDAYLDEPFVEPFSAGGGRTMSGWLLVEEEGIESAEELETWVDRAIGYTGSLPPK
jgi:TfoX/Sxy family transcriptional regulator of competence genes